MILDANLRLASAFAPTAVSTVLAPNYLDTLALQDWGMGNDWLWVIQIPTAFTSGGAATLDLKLLGNPNDPTFTAGNVTIIDTGVIALASLVAGYQLFFKVPRQAIPLPGASEFANDYRYMTLSSTIATAAMTAGAINSWITLDGVQDNRTSPAGYTVL